MEEQKGLTLADVVQGLDGMIEINDMKIAGYKQGLEILDESIGKHFTEDLAKLTEGFIKDLEFNQEWLKALRILMTD